MTAPCVAHVIHHLIMGGMENGLINLINHMPEHRYRHVVVCMTGYSDFAQRIERRDVPIYALNKRQGGDRTLKYRLWRLFRELRPAIVHGRNHSGFDALLPAALAGVSCRIHGEHGRDMNDLNGSNRRFIWLRRLHAPLIDRFVPVSKNLQTYLEADVGVSPRKVRQIYNGVDTLRFYPANGAAEVIPVPGFSVPDCIVIGSVLRLQAVKDPLNLAQAFIQLVTNMPDLRSKLRLVIVGDGPLKKNIEDLLRSAGVYELAWLSSASSTVPQLMRCFDIFVLPSLAEGISNTILEAMASGLPVVATAVGGNGELLRAGETGYLVPPADPTALAQAIGRYVHDPDLRHRHGHAARQRAIETFSLKNMVERYLALYDEVLARA